MKQSSSVIHTFSIFACGFPNKTPCTEICILRENAQKAMQVDDNNMQKCVLETIAYKMPCTEKRHRKICFFKKAQDEAKLSLISYIFLIFSKST